MALEKKSVPAGYQNLMNVICQRSLSFYQECLLCPNRLVNVVFWTYLCFTFTGLNASYGATCMKAYMEQDKICADVIHVFCCG